MDYYEQGATYEDIYGEVFEHEAYMDAIDKAECEEKCWYSATDIHRMSCPLFSGLDVKKSREAERQIDMARGK
jgi:hypothetical protein